MAKLSYGAARAICCRAWGITPPQFDELVEAGEVGLDDLFLQVDLEISTYPHLIEYAHPGIKDEVKERKINAQNAAAFEAMYHQAMAKKKNLKGGKK